MLSVKKELDPFSAQLKRLYWLDYVNTDGNCSKAEVDIFPVNSNIVVNYSRLKTLLNNKIPPQIGQVQNSLESCMDKQTVEFQTQVPFYLVISNLWQAVGQFVTHSWPFSDALFDPPVVESLFRWLESNL